ncbi:hypothetical protein SAMN02745728_01214 [Desulfovibrio litoralis DSM 11393]|uniref:Uncharacterized protein n=1 Tax=Desulfovibrio litoralis DSM 11393 TaxID=1121455 RepID=A0A1M7SSE1_9BACT|nr:hypothetical protein [Desulfovibrio litoralis]SHN61351.1 hypothetical protein SAMN02745728_01214 [Desulfovibrio litoralis DSM 11393]
MNYTILMLKPKKFTVWALAFLCSLLLSNIAEARYLEELTDSKAPKPVLRLAYIAESWGELYPCPG